MIRGTWKSLVFATALASGVMWAQERNPLAGFPRPGASAASDTRPFDPKDFSGVWRGDKYGYNGNYVPPMTPEGQKKFDSYRPSYGLRKDSAEAQRQTNVPIGRRRAIPPAQGNDPVGACNPLGLIRLLLYDPSPMEIVQTPDRILQLFEWTWDRREIWTDGRSPANVDEYLPRFNGYSVGKWDSNTLIVNTVGLDDRAWVDHFGYPISDQAKLEERWRRTSFSTLELTMILNDPKIYTQPWTSEVVRFIRIPKEALAAGVGWAALAEDRCVPLDEVETYNKEVRNPAGGVK